jgi:F-type H+-transporting ATPase subunit b
MEWLGRVFDSGRSRIRIKGLVVAVSIFSLAGVAFASSGGSGPVQAKEWLNTDWYRVMNFAVLAIGLFLIVRKPVGQAMGARIKSIKDQLSELDAQKKDAEKTLAQFNEKISHLEQEASKIIAQYEEQGKAVRQRILEEAAAAAQKMEEQAKRNIEQEFTIAKVKLQEEIIAKAMVEAEALVNKSITSEDQERLVDEYINKVVA